MKPPINFSEIRNILNKEENNCLQLLKKLSRNTVNVGVVGLMRMGKSTFLQTISGITSHEIPIGDLGACTSVQSNIYHHDGNTYANIYLHSEKSFLSNIIADYYIQLNLENPPESLSSFMNCALPEKRHLIRSMCQLIKI